MTQYIDKTAVVAEIERRIKIHHDYGHYNAEREFTKVLSFLNNLEVKEVDLEKEINNAGMAMTNHQPSWKEVECFARHFFELGLAQKGLELTWEDISIIRQIMFDYNRQIRNEMTIPSDEDYCKELLQRFKAQKGG